MGVMSPPPRQPRPIPLYYPATPSPVPKGYAMTTSKQMEPTANVALGNLLRSMMPGCTVRSENTQTFSDHPGRHADVLVTADGRSPVTVEAEFEPAPEAEKDARERLGLKVENELRAVEASVAVRYPAALERAYDIPAELAESTLSYCVLTIERRNPTPDQEIQAIDRFPESGWLEGSVSDLADLVRIVSAPRLDVDTAANALQDGIDRVATILEEMDRSRPNINATIARILGLDNVPQTRRMAGAILANALVFHEHIAGRHPGIKPVAQVCGPQVGNPQSETLAAWAKILEINYWPIFGVSTEILSSLTAAEAKEILNTLQYTVGEFTMLGLENAHNLTGRVFQRLISDRKYLATFYTLPESAALLARLAVARLDGVDWSDRQAIGKLRVADFACGTGALLSAVYEQIAARHERAGGDLEALHSVLLEDVLYGYDVLPSAVHITAATLAGAQPKVGFRKTHLDSLSYGRLSDNSIAIGSLEFLKSNSQLTFSNFSDPARRISGDGEQPTPHSIAEAEDDSFDLVIMNPPFTSNTKHYDAEDGVLNAAFAAFDSSENEQSAMSARLKLLSANTVYHGHAGLGSVFASLADKKLRPNGVMALVLPFTVVNGASWVKFRELVDSRFEDVTIVSIAANGKEMSFSSDTGIAECLIIARKKIAGKRSSNSATFVSLKRRPSDLANALEIGKSLVESRRLRSLEDGPYGGSPIHSGNAVEGNFLKATVSNYEGGWGAARVADFAVAQVAQALSRGILWPPAMPEGTSLPIVQLGKIGRLGVHDSMLTLGSHKGPFIKETPSDTATFPSLYNHHASAETRLICLPDSQLLVRPGMEERADQLWKTASRTHLNRDFTFGSQALAIAFTEQDSIGGRVWPNIIFAEKRFEYCFSLWGNSTLGLLAFWWQSSRQQSSKASLTRLAIPLLPVLDFRTLTDAQLTQAEEIFEEFRDKELLPAYLADADPNRALLDRCVICDLLGFDESVHQGVRRLAQKWCAEPSVHGGKPRPKNATFAT